MGRRTIDDVTCLGCGCLCDDIAVTVDGGRVVEARAACELGRGWFLDDGHVSPRSPARVEGVEAALEEAVGRAVAVLAGARSPVVFGLTETVTETVREAIGLAERLGARVVLNRSERDLRRVSAFQNQGRVSATLGEVKNRADLVVFWRCDPVRTHPRHWERYSVEPTGRFVPEGRRGRTVVVVDTEPTATAERADLFIPLPSDRDAEAVAALRLTLAGRSWGAGLGGLADRMTGARYGALFFQEHPDVGGRSGALWESVARLVRDLNDRTRFVLLGMGSKGNPAGAEAAMTWQSGFLQGVDYRLGHPAPADDLATLNDLLESGEPDAVLAVGSGWPVALSGRARAHLDSIPRVVLGPGATLGEGPAPTVAIATATPGIDAPGTVMRSDGVTLPTRPALSPRFPSDRELIRLMIGRLNLVPGALTTS